MSRYKFFLLSWLCAALVTGGVVGAFNFIVDPYGFYGVVNISGFNQQKEGVRNKIRYVKALELPLRKPTTIVMGSSRVHDGVNPQHFLLQESLFTPVYNLGVDMNRIHEVLKYLKHSIIHTEVKRVILGLDFFMFNAAQKVNFNFDPNLVGRKISFVDYISTSLLSRGALQDSIETIKTSYAQPERKEFLSNGYRPGNFVFYKLNDYSSLHYYTNYIFLSPLPSQTKYYFDMYLDEQVFADFEEILKLCKQNNIDIKMYISPAHANLDGDGIVAAGKWEMMEVWKRRIAKIADRYETSIWDFSGYNSVTTESVQTPMKYYWDSSHFTEITSDLILKRIFDSSVYSHEIPDDFGVKLSSENIELDLEKIRKAREIYIAKNPSDTAKRDLLYKSILDGAPLDAKKLDRMFSP